MAEKVKVGSNSGDYNDKTDKKLPFINSNGAMSYLTPDAKKAII